MQSRLLAISVEEAENDLGDRISLISRSPFPLEADGTDNGYRGDVHSSV
jgi:hypothetical protein